MVSIEEIIAPQRAFSLVEYSFSFVFWATIDSFILFTEWVVIIQSNNNMISFIFNVISGHDHLRCIIYWTCLLFSGNKKTFYLLLYFHLPLEENVTFYHCIVYNSLTLLNTDSRITYRENLEFVTSVTHKILDMGSTIYKNAITSLQTWINNININFIF